MKPENDLVDNQRAFSILLLQLALRFARRKMVLTRATTSRGLYGLQINHLRQSPAPAGDRSLRFLPSHHDRNVRKTTNFPAQRQAIVPGSIRSNRIRSGGVWRTYGVPDRRG